MKQQIEQLIDSLADKSLTFGCRLRGKEGGKVYICIGHYQNYIDYLDLGSEHVPSTHCSIESWNLKHHFEILGHPILIGDVLERVSKKYNAFSSKGIADCRSYFQQLTDLWWECGFTKSLQEIFEECEWEEVRNLCMKHGTSRFTLEGCTCKAKKNKPLITVPKDQNIKALFEFLLSLDL